MGPIAALERFFERLFERPTARLFRTRLQPVQLQHRIERAMEAGRRQMAGRVVVPDQYVVRLNAMDLAAFEPIAATLAPELADAALAFARRHHYALRVRPTVALRASPGITPGEIEVAAEFGAADGPIGGAGEQTMAFPVPTVVAPVAVLREVRRDGTSRTIELDGRPVALGRAADNQLVLDDPQVSRHHARIQARRGSLVLTDLGSTNGTWVGGVRVDEVVLGAGDTIEIGDTTLVIDSVAS
jgi:hypothetical protein